MSITSLAEGPQTLASPASPPLVPPSNIALGNHFPDDEIKELGDRIAKLTSAQSVELDAYMKATHG